MSTLLLSVFFTVSASAYDVEVDGIYYYLNKTKKTAEVTYREEGIDSYYGSIEIPSSILIKDVEYKIASIGDFAFCFCSGLTSITIPNSVTSIGSRAFYNCSGLTSITIPNSVTSIGDFAFSGCSGLTAITISNFVTSIGSEAFAGCLGLTSITIPNSVTSIGAGAFSGCSGLTSITIPNSVTSIGDYLLYGCDGIKNTIIVNDIFVYLPKTYSGNYSILDNVTTIIGGAFAGCSGLISISLPNSVTSIGTGAFSDCSGLISISLPNSVTSIGNSAFAGCSGLTSITIPNSVTSIGDYTFNRCSGLTSITIPNCITSIGVWAFYGCSGLTSITIPNSVTSIGDRAFSNCYIEKLYYDSSVNPNIPSYYLKELTIGDNLSIVHDYFKEAPLTKIVLGKKVSQIRAEAFKNSKLEEFTVTSEEPPYLYPNVFGSQDLSKATLYVPESKVEYYQTTEPWSNFGKVLTLSGDTPAEPKKCATPSISYSDGKLLFSCETEGAKCNYTVSCPDAASGETSTENKSVTLNAYYDITCYAKAEGFVNSDVATAKLYWLTSSGSLDSSINAAKTRGVVIQSAAGFITISGLDSTEQVDFFASDGKSLGIAKAIGGTATFAAQSGSVVVAKIGKESVKIAVE